MQFARIKLQKIKKMERGGYIMISSKVIEAKTYLMNVTNGFRNNSLKK